MPHRYHPLLVALHWIVAILLLMALIAGKFGLPSLAPGAEGRLEAYGIHMFTGIALLVLMLIRLAVKARTAKPAPASTGNPLFDRIGTGTHHLLYALVIAMALSGIWLGMATGLGDAVLNGAPMPERFGGTPARGLHGLLSNLLILTLLLHIGAALWHQFVKHDGLMGRMWFGRR